MFVVKHSRHNRKGSLLGRQDHRQDRIVLQLFEWTPTTEALIRTCICEMIDAYENRSKRYEDR